jgi:hypothetical protein
VDEVRREFKNSQLVKEAIDPYCIKGFAKETKYVVVHFCPV